MAGTNDGARAEQFIAPQTQKILMARDRKRMVIDSHAFLLLMLFVPPTMMCYSLGVNIDAWWFIGSGAFIGLAIIPLFLVQYVLQFYYKFPDWAFLFTLLIPSIILIAVGGASRSYLVSISTQMSNTDCTAYVPKRDLQLAYGVGRDILNSCTAQLGRTPPDGIEECIQYRETYKKHGYEFEYLKELERRFDCSGICQGDVNLFTRPGQRSRPCHLAIREQLRGANLQATTILWYSVVVFVLSFPLYLLCRPLLKEFYI